MTFAEWLRHAQIMIRARPYSFVGHEYLRQIVNDPSPDQTFMKAAQVAISTVTLLKGIYVAEHLGKKALYFFQDDAAVSDFSNDRCLSILQESPYLTERVRGINNVGLKKIGPGALYFRGLFSKGKAKSVDGDFVIFDEVAEMNERNRQLARDRVMHSSLQWIHALSQPEIPGSDIDAEFSSTDQHYWHLICPSCGYKDNVLELDFPDNNNFREYSSKERKTLHPKQTHYRGCAKCGAKLNMDDGVWVPHQSKDRRGYHLSQLYTWIVPPDFPNYASHIMNEYYESRRAQSKMSRFTISILGFPFGGGAARVTDQVLDECEGSHGWSYSEVGAYMGVDQGDLLTIAIGIRSGPFLLYTYFEETENWGRLDQLMEQFGIHYCVIDAQPNKKPAKDFAYRHNGRVSIQYFSGNAYKEDEEPHVDGGRAIMVKCVKQDRTEALDGFIDNLEAHLLYFPARQKCSDLPLARLVDVRRHLKKLTVKFETDKRGNVTRAYAAGPNIENHYGMACNNCMTAAYRFGGQATPMVMPVFIKAGGRA